MTDLASRRRSAAWRRPGPWLLAGLILAASAIPGGLAAAHLVRVAPLVGYARPEAGMTVNFTNVQMTDRPAYVPRYLNVSAVSGTLEVNVRLNNTGSALTHTFTVVNASQSDVPVNRTFTPAQLHSYFTTYPPTINRTVAAGQVAWANFSLPASTHFRSLEFVSTLPYQFQAGMWGYLNLTPAGPTYTLEDNATPAFAFVPDVLSSPVGVSGAITFHIHVFNTGSVSHTFTVSSQPNQTYTSVASLLRPHAPLSNVSIPGGAGSSNWSNFTVPGIGVYEYVCTVPGHFSQGMYGFLYVGVAVPPPPAVPSTAIAEVPVLVGSAILLGIGLFLTLSSAFLGRFPKSPPSPGHPP